MRWVKISINNNAASNGGDHCLLGVVTCLYDMKIGLNQSLRLTGKNK